MTAAIDPFRKRQVPDVAVSDRAYRGIEQIRAAFYPRCARLLDLPPDAIIGWPGKSSSEGGRR